MHRLQIHPISHNYRASPTIPSSYIRVHTVVRACGRGQAEILNIVYSARYFPKTWTSHSHVSRPKDNSAPHFGPRIGRPSDFCHDTVYDYWSLPQAIIRIMHIKACQDTTNIICLTQKVLDCSKKCRTQYDDHRRPALSRQSVFCVSIMAYGHHSLVPCSNLIT